jgi:hypothetical protein
MSLKYFARYRFNTDDPAEEETGYRDLAIETGTIETTVDATYGSALILDGQTSLLSTGSFNEISGDQERSFSFWVRIDDITDFRPVFCYGELDSPNAFVWYASNETSALPEFFDYSDRSTDTTVITPGSWVFYTITYSSTNLLVYINGTLSSTLNVGTLTTGNIDPLRIGTDGIGEYFIGAMLDLRVFDSVLQTEAVSYLFQNGPNFEGPLGTSYAEEYDTRGLSMSGGLICRSTYGIQEEGQVQKDHFFASCTVNDESVIVEAARIENSRDGISGNIKYKVKDIDDTLKTVIETTPAQTTFTNNEKAVLFSSEGVSVLNESIGGMYFGAGRDFRITVNDNKFVVQAFSSVTEDYVTKMEISP